MADALKDKWDKAFRGLRALITQSYVEANVKNGLQFEASVYNAAAAQKIAAYITWYEGTPDLPEA